MVYKKFFKVLLLCFVFVGLFSIASSVNAVSPITELKGWAWSSNIGWISFNCKNIPDSCVNNNYSVKVDANGALSGYAWSNNVGWLKFGGLSNFPIGSGTVSQNAILNPDNTITGWARFCAGTDNGICSDMDSREDGWDGWVSLSGSSPTYGVKLKSDNKTFEGFSWGSDVVGWIDFRQVIGENDGLSVSLSAEPTNVERGGTTKLSWDVKNAVSCETSSAPENTIWNSATVDPKITLGLGSKDGVLINADTTFYLECEDSNEIPKKVSANVKVTVGGRCNPATDPNCCPGGSNCDKCPGGCCPGQICPPTRCELPDGTKIDYGEVSDRLFYKARLVPSGSFCDGKLLTCTTDGLTPPNYIETSCRVSPDIKPI